MAVGVDDAEAVEELTVSLSLAYPVLRDGALAITKAYGVIEGGSEHPRPATFVLDENRKVVYRHVGKNAADRPVLPSLVAALGS